MCSSDLSNTADEYRTLSSGSKEIKANAIIMFHADTRESADLDARYAAKIAEREIFLKGELTKAVQKGDGEEYALIEKQIVSERKKFQTELEEKKDAVRSAGK